MSRTVAPAGQRRHTDCRGLSWSRRAAIDREIHRSRNGISEVECPSERVRLEGLCERGFRRTREGQANARSRRRPSRNCARLRRCRGKGCQSRLRSGRSVVRGSEPTSREGSERCWQRRLRRAVSDPTLGKPILTEAAQEDLKALRIAALACTISGRRTSVPASRLRSCQVFCCADLQGIAPRIGSKRESELLGKSC